jgi:hypothetical protein
MILEYGSRRHRSLAALVVLAAAGCASVPNLTPQTGALPVPAASRVITPTHIAKDAPCIQTTHGCLALSPDVTEATVSKTTCVAGYTRSVRPATSYTNGVKAKLLRGAGLDETRMGDFELDHTVPLALGGHPRKLSNLELQPWAGEHGAWRKDALKARMHNLVCEGELTLTEGASQTVDAAVNF